ncbi:hypothetical protein GCM10022232_18060 [Streptomyces plumbiresistens]|uniref:Uncharacterized protein n=1 Tax=Streptomyces plumbiresistens TaxID=511811 RepID=A0ABP7QNM5_9ACTN
MAKLGTGFQERQAGGSVLLDPASRRRLAPSLSEAACPAPSATAAFPYGHPRLSAFRPWDPYTYVDTARRHPVADEIASAWSALFENTEFRGITADGRPVPDRF